MGETGCGKTRLVKFMCGLQLPPGLENKSQNMILMKVGSVLLSSFLLILGASICIK